MAIPNVPYHRQERTDYCGAACLQMVLEALGGTSENQPALYNDSHDHGTQDPQQWWSSPPDGIEWTLGDGLNLAVQVTSVKGEMSLTRQLVWSLFRHSFPPIALVYGWAHWVVVVNYGISRDPDGPSDDGYTVKAVEILDPWRTVEEGDPPPPPPPRHVTLKEWRRTYLKPVPHGHWKNNVVAVGVFTP